MTGRTIGLAALLLALTAGALPAQEAPEKEEPPSLKGVKFGRHVYGRPVPEALTGRVVAVVAWGINSAECIALLPALDALDKQHLARGLVLVAQHRHSASLESEVVTLATARRLTMTVTQGGSLSFADPLDVPRAWLFSPVTGRLVWSGHPTGLAPKVQQQLNAAPHFLLKGKAPQDARVAAYATKLREGRDFAKVLRALDSVISKGKRSQRQSTIDQVADARHVRTCLIEHADKALARARALEATDPAAAFAAYGYIKAAWRGHDYEDQAQAHLDALARDETFMDALAAAKQLRAIDQLVPKLVPGGPMKPTNRQLIVAIGQIAVKMSRKWPTSPYTATARTVASAYGVKLPALKAEDDQ